MIESIALVTNPRRDGARREAEKAAESLRAAGIRTFFPQSGESDEACGLVMTFGGDGTLLMGAKTAMDCRCPLLGINMGTVGFLTEGDPSGMDRILRAVMDGAYTIEKRGLLRIQVNEEPEIFHALNDAVVTRGGFARLIQVETRVNGELWDTFTADGVIAATPTGSTGYSLSAGGPVVAPGVDCMVITPVCAHSLQRCPCVVPTDTEITFHLCAEREQLAELQIDGRGQRMLKKGETVRVTGAQEALQLARLEDYHFFTVLQSKLNEWSRPREEQAR